MWSHDDDLPRFRHNEWQKVFDEQLNGSASSLFTLPLGGKTIKWTQWLTKEAVWERFHTISMIAVLTGKELEVLWYGHQSPVLTTAGYQKADI